MSELENKRILIFQQRGWAINIGHELSIVLKAEGCYLAALTIKNSTHDFIISQRDVVYDLIVNGDSIKEDPLGYLAGEEYDLSDICADLDICSIWPLIQASRNHVKSYKDKYYYGFKQNLSDEEIINYVKAIYKNILFIFSEFCPEVIITPNYAGLQHILFNLYANKHGVEMIGVIDSKVKGVWIFNHNYLGSKGRFFNRLTALNNGEVSSNENKAKKYLEETKKSYQKITALEINDKKVNYFSINTIKKEILPFYFILEYYFSSNKNKLKNLDVSLDYKTPKYILRDHFSEKRNKIFADRFTYYNLDKCRKYIYFPLQVQPESTIDVVASRFNNQIETARQVAMSMPGNYTLVVKDHPGMIKRRSPSYLEKISRTPNIKLIDYRINTNTVLRNAKMVISPSSTTISEAAFLGIPCIQLGDLGTTAKLPNVYQHKNINTLSEKINEILHAKVDHQEIYKNLINYISATYDVGMELDYKNVWTHGGGKELDAICKAFKNEIVYYLSSDNSNICDSNKYA